MYVQVKLLKLNHKNYNPLMNINYKIYVSIEKKDRLLNFQKVFLTCRINYKLLYLGQCSITYQKKKRHNKKDVTEIFLMHCGGFK